MAKTITIPANKIKAGVFQRVLGIELAVQRVIAATGEQAPFVRMKAEVSIMVEAPNADSAFTARVIGDLTQPSDDFDKLEEDIRSALHSFVDPNDEGVPDARGGAVRVALIKEGPTLVPKAMTPESADDLSD
jgi:hypothetical protein